LLGVVSVLVAGNAFANCLERSNSGEDSTHHLIVISGFQFVPDKLNVAIGDTVTWINQDIVPHSILVDEGLQAISPNFKTGEEFKLVIENPFNYSCGLHPSMKGKLNLTKDASNPD
jgi:plastocyanin